MNKSIIKFCTPEYKLHQKPSRRSNKKKKKFLDELISYNLESLKALEAFLILIIIIPKTFLMKLNKFLSEN